MRIQATLLALLGLLVSSQAQMKVVLQFGTAGPREVFVAPALPGAPPSKSVQTSGATLDFNLPGFGAGDRIYVWDHTTNNIASKPIKDISNGVWAVKEYSLIGSFSVRVEHKGEPLQAAKIAISGKGKSEEKLLDPSGKGEVQFFGYPPGDLRVKVTYNTADKKQTSQELVFAEALKRDKPEPVLTFAVPDDVATVAPTAPASPAPETKKEEPAGGSVGGKVAIMLIAIVAILGLGFWVFHMAKHKPREFEATLQKLGVQIPSQQDPDAGAPIPVTPLPPAPPAPKIMLEDAEPAPLGGPAVAAPIAPASTEPTLVRDSGERIALVEGETLVGREDGLGLSLAGESTVSRRHAHLTRSGGSVTLTDLGSTNGTFVNGNRLQSETVLKPGDQVQFGSVRFRFEG